MELVYSTVPDEGIPALQKFYKDCQRDCFLMKMREEFDETFAPVEKKNDYNAYSLSIGCFLNMSPLPGGC